jgi:hypothetical protein
VTEEQQFFFVLGVSARGVVFGSGQKAEAAKQIHVVLGF